MKTTSIHRIVAVVITVCAVVLWQQTGAVNDAGESSMKRAPETKQPRRGHALDDLAVRTEIASLRTEIASLRAETRRSDTRADEPDTPTAEPPGPRRDNPYASLPAVERDVAIADDLHVAMTNESTDGSWSHATETAFLTALADIDTADVVDLECRSTLCRVELAHPDRDGRLSATDTFTAAIPWEASGYVHMVSSEPPTSVIYVARAGHQLPAPDAP